jgi:ankyrin repeat protein
MILAIGRANLKDTNRYGGAAPIPAAHHGHSDTVRILLSTVININHVNDLGWTVLIAAVILGDGGKARQEIVGLMLAAGADRSIADSYGAMPLAHAKARGFTEIAHLLERQASVAFICTVIPAGWRHSRSTAGLPPSAGPRG